MQCQSDRNKNERFPEHLFDWKTPLYVLVENLNIDPDTSSRF